MNYSHSIGDTTKVSNYPNGASPYGALNMAGNVWEWVGDWYISTYYDNLPTSNPFGPNSGSARVLRGGSWNGDENGVRATSRNFSFPRNTGYFIGFRCAMSATP